MPLPKVIIEAPPITPLPYGILSAAVVRDPQDPHEAGGVQWEPQFCGSAHGTLAACVTTPLPPVSVVGNTSRLVALGGEAWPTESGDYTVDWGDGTVVTDVSPFDMNGLNHTYAANGVYTIQISVADGNVTFVVPVLTVTSGQAIAETDITVSWVPPKTTDERAGWVESRPFTIYHISTCRLVGTTDREAYATRALSLGEGRGIEEGLGAWFADPDADVDVLEGGDAASAVVALAWLEQYAGANYGGVATIHMNRATASVLLTAYALETRDGKLYTRLGNLVIAGAGEGYPGTPDGEDTEDGSSFMFATGTVVVTRGAVSTSPAVYSTGGLIDNEYSVLAERIVSVGYECFLAAAHVLPLDAGGAGDGSNGSTDGGTP